MRWSAQEIIDDGIGAAPTLPGLRGLLRSVRTPEFAGTVFHEVEAKSALNRVPGSSPLPFRWTVNPYRGCSHACVYCLGGHTPVMLPDGRVRPIAELRIGDEVLGTEVVDGHRRYVRTTVRARWSTVKQAYRVRLVDGTDLLAGGEHRFLSAVGWRHVRGGWCRAGRRRVLAVGSVLLGPGRSGPAPRPTPAYRRGYLDGLIHAEEAAGRSFPSAALGLEALARTHHFLATDGDPALGGAWLPAVAVGGAAEPGRIAPPSRSGLGVASGADPGWPSPAGAEWCRGFLAGVVDSGPDTAGADSGELRIRIGNGGIGNGGIGGRIVAAGDRLGFRFVPAADPRGAALRLAGGVAAFLRFCRATDPAGHRQRDLCGAPVTGDPASTVESVEPAGVQRLYDITTGTGDFVADGVVSHNCFARPTHTYLDLDAGADFDSQIVVKVNVARVLRRELGAPRWTREPVAMGTNTDPYQRAEGRYRLMPDVIGALARSGTPFSLLTKGTVLARDLPVLSAVADDVPVRLGVSIALVDRGLQARLEPGTPSPTARLDLVRRIRDAGLPCGVMVAPVLPLLTDSAERLDALLERIAAAGADGATVLALHLRPGTREWFLAWLAREHPALVEPYARLYRRGAYVDPEYRRALAERVAPLLRRHRLRGSDDTRREPATPEPRTDPPPAEQLTLL